MNMRNHIQVTGVMDGALELEELCGANIPFELHAWIEKPCLFSPAAAVPKKKQLQFTKK